jgi:hypothetical protein
LAAPQQTTVGQPRQAGHDMVKRPGAGPGDASGSRLVERRSGVSGRGSLRGLQEQKLPSYGASVVVRAGAHILASASYAAHRRLRPAELGLALAVAQGALPRTALVR